MISNNVVTVTFPRDSVRCNIFFSEGGGGYYIISELSKYFFPLSSEKSLRQLCQAILFSESSLFTPLPFRHLILMLSFLPPSPCLNQYSFLRIFPYIFSYSFPSYSSYCSFFSLTSFFFFFRFFANTFSSSSSSTSRYTLTSVLPLFPLLLLPVLLLLLLLLFLLFLPLFLLLLFKFISSNTY